MKLSEIYKIADELAPKKLSDEYCEKYGAYDNSGILVNTGEEIEKILFSLDLTDCVVERAILTGAKLIVTHHPAIYGKISCLSVFDNLGAKLTKCIQNGISVVSMHLNLDCAKGGIDECLADGVKIASGIADTLDLGDSAVMHELSAGGYGRVYGVKTTSAEMLKNELNKVFKTERTLVYKEDKKIERIASFCGSGCDEEGIAFALKNGADAVVSSDFKHHVIALALENELAVISLTHYASECYGFEKYYEKISRQVEIPCEFFKDEALL